MLLQKEIREIKMASASGQRVLIVQQTRETSKLNGNHNNTVMISMNKKKSIEKEWFYKRYTMLLIPIPQAIKAGAGVWHDIVAQLTGKPW